MNPSPPTNVNRSPFSRRQTKHIKTKKVQRLERADKAVWLIPLVICGFSFLRGGEAFAGTFEEGFGVGVFTILSFIAIFAIFYLPLMMIWRAVSRTLKKSAIAQTTFPVLEDFNYYRDELTDVSPATISMCTDYEIERDKDLTAQLLKFTMQGLIQTDGNQIVVLQDATTTQTLTHSERFLLDSLREGELTTATAERWAALARQEVLDGPYLSERRHKTSKIKGPIGCLPFFVMIAIIVRFVNSDAMMLLDELDDEMSNAEFLALMANDPRYIWASAAVIIVAVALFASMMFPFSHTIAGFLKWKTRNPYQRTKQGDILTEEIYGLKNFIHDFSDLEHAQKETLVLWDDFLIYAVLLEENTAIVEEITRMRQLNIHIPTYTD